MRKLILPLMILLGSMLVLSWCFQKDASSWEIVGSGKQVISKNSDWSQKLSNLAMKQKTMLNKINPSYHEDVGFNYCLSEKFDVCLFEVPRSNGQEVACEDYLLDINKQACSETGTWIFMLPWTDWEWILESFSFEKYFWEKSYDIYLQQEWFWECFEKKIDVCIEESSYRKWSSPACDDYISEGRIKLCQSKSITSTWETLSIKNTIENFENVEVGGN